MNNIALDILIGAEIGLFIGLCIIAIDVTYRGYLQRKRIEAEENRWKEQDEKEE